MTENWEDIIKNKLQHDAITPPPSAWESINDSSVDEQNQVQNPTGIPPSQFPKNSPLKSFNTPKFNPISGELASKSAAVFIGIAASAIAVCTYATKFSNPQLPTPVGSNRQFH